MTEQKAFQGPCRRLSRANIDRADVYKVLYMGILYPVAKQFQNVWYRETRDGYKPFALQGRVRPVRD
jgi:hypothetical protein